MTSWVMLAPLLTMASRNPRLIRSPMTSQKPEGTIGPARVSRLVYSGSLNIPWTTSAAAPILPAPRTPVPPISRTSSPAVIPGWRRMCLMGSGGLGLEEKDPSALSTSYHSTAHNVPVLYLVSGREGSSELLIGGHRSLEGLVVLHVHYLDGVS